MNRHARRAAKASSQPDERQSLIGKMLAHVQGELAKRAADWINDGKDITEMVFLLFAKSNGGGAIEAKTRSEFAAGIVAEGGGDALLRAGQEVLGGPRDKIPAVFLFVDVPAVEVAWIDPISSAEVH
jgi:hypothetical protein